MGTHDDWQMGKTKIFLKVSRTWRAVNSNLAKVGGECKLLFGTLWLHRVRAKGRSGFKFHFETCVFTGPSCTFLTDHVHSGPCLVVSPPHSVGSPSSRVRLGRREE